MNKARLDPCPLLRIIILICSSAYRIAVVRGQGWQRSRLPGRRTRCLWFAGLCRWWRRSGWWLRMQYCIMLWSKFWFMNQLQPNRMIDVHNIRKRWYCSTFLANYFKPHSKVNTTDNDNNYSDTGNDYESKIYKCK